MSFHMAFNPRDRSGPPVEVRDSEGTAYTIPKAEYDRRMEIEPQIAVGAWWSVCCEQSLYQIENDEDIAEVRQCLWDDEVGEGWWVEVFPSREAGEAWYATRSLNYTELPMGAVIVDVPGASDGQH